MTTTFQTEPTSQSATEFAGNLATGPDANPMRGLRDGEYASESATEGARLEALDRRLAQLGRGVGALRLRMGEALEAFANRGGVAAFGFSSLAAYAVQRLGRTGHWAADARSLARRLAALPELRRALVAGELGTSMVELLARFATPLNEADLPDLIGEARGSTVRAMRERLAVGDAEPDARPDKGSGRATVMATLSSVEALAFERARLLIEAVGDTRSRDEVVEAMLAEGLGDILTRWPDVAIPFGLGTETAARAAWRAEVAGAEREAERAAEAVIRVAPVVWAGAGEAAEEEALPADVYGLDKCLRGWSTELATRDLALADLGRQMFGGRGYVRLGYVSFEQYARERIGLSPSAMKARVTLAQRVAALPEIRAAVSEGRLGFETASMVARVAGRANVDDWIARAETRTVKHLREEIDAVEMMARVSGMRTIEGPPDEDTMEALRDVERSALESASDVGGQMPPHGVGGRGDEMPPVESDSQMSGGHPSGKVPLRISLRDDLARFWRTLEGIHQKVDPETSFVWFLCESVERAWRGAHGGQVAYQDVYLRDRFRCANPTCSRRDVTPHHIKFRSHGGGEERSNLISLCTVCHLDLVHGSRIKVLGRRS